MIHSSILPAVQMHLSEPGSDTIWYVPSGEWISFPLLTGSLQVSELKYPVIRRGCVHPGVIYAHQPILSPILQVREPMMPVLMSHRQATICAALLKEISPADTRLLLQQPRHFASSTFRLHHHYKHLFPRLTFVECSTISLPSFFQRLSIVTAFISVSPECIKSFVA